jgi:hypothetical protein
VYIQCQFIILNFKTILSLQSLFDKNLIKCILIEWFFNNCLIFYQVVSLTIRKTLFTLTTDTNNLRNFNLMKPKVRWLMDDETVIVFKTHGMAEHMPSEQQCKLYSHQTCNLTMRLFYNPTFTVGIFVF